jgi:transcriptional regulator with XRE-family HTH domain
MVVPPKPRYPWRALGTRIAAARLARGWTAHQLAVAVGAAVPTVGTWERGERRPRPDTLRRLATMLAVPYQKLAALAEYPRDERDA